MAGNRRFETVKEVWADKNGKPNVVEEGYTMYNKRQVRLSCYLRRGAVSQMTSDHDAPALHSVPRPLCSTLQCEFPET